MEVLQAFLSEPRQATLMQRLAAQQVPHANARRLATYPHHIPTLDQLLASLVGRLGVLCEALLEASANGNEELQQKAARMLQSDLAVFNAYTREIVARRLPKDLFPRTNSAINARGVQ